jgi:GR25 family glycosyltransferase involved in LPS biosynthesis
METTIPRQHRPVERERVGQIPVTGWASFGRIYCISLTDRQDRRRQAESEFARAGFADRVEFVIVDKHPSDTERGIFESHIACLRRGLAEGAQTIVVFEDDIVLDRYSERTLNNAVHFMTSQPGWNMFFFGCFIEGCRRIAFPSVLKVRYRCTAHAYVINRAFAEKLVKIPWQGIAYDDVLRSMQDEQFYAAYPAFAFQSSSPTDNDKMLRVDRIRRRFGGLHWQQKWNEFSHFNFRGLIVGHSLTIAAIILLTVALFRHFGHHSPH